MMRNTYYSICVILLTLLSLNSYASHVSGVDIDYVCLGNGQYMINVNLYRDCDGIPMPATIDIEIESNCGANQTITLPMGIPIGGTIVGGVEISQLCPAYLPQSTCNGGTLPGMERYIYSGVVTLSPACDPWRVSWSVCCRNSIDNIILSPSYSIYGEVLMYTATDSCNNSAVFTAQPIPYVCVNQPVFYNFGAYDPDGDSLAYSLIPARTTPTGFLPYVAGYSPAQPIPGITIDPQTGALSFTPTITGLFVVVVLVKEYDANGNIVGSVMRDIQFAVINCPNNTPPIPAAQTSSVSGNVTVTGPNSFLICPGEFMSFDVTFTDIDALDTISLSSNVANVLPGSTFSQTGTNPAVATITWTATSTNMPSISSFVVSAVDNGCTTPGINQQTILVQLADSLQAGPDVLLCNGGGVQLGVTGGTSYLWSVLAGPPIIVGTNFSCDTCNNPIATPTTTTTYKVESNVVGQCLNADTLTITVVPQFDIGNVVLTDVTCNGLADGQIMLSPSGAAGPPWTWELMDGTIQLDSITNSGGQTFTGLGPGVYSVILSEANGCSVDTIGLVINEPPVMSIVAGDTLICLGSSATVSAQAFGGNGNYSYIWNNGLVGSGPHTVSPSNSTYYTVIATDQLGCPSPLDSFLVAVNPPLLLNPIWSDSICVGSSATLVGGGSGGNGGPYTYSWTQAGFGSLGVANSITVTPNTSSSSFTVTMSDSCGTPPVTMTLVVEWHETPQPLLSPDVFEACAPAMFNFSNDTDPVNVGNTCVWDLGDGTVVSGGCGSLSHVYQNAGCYDVGLTVFSPAGCMGDTTYSQLVCARPSPLADYTFGPQPTTVDDPLIYFFNESVNGVSYDWQFGWNGVLGNSAATDPVFTFPNNDQGAYPVWLYTTNIYDCVDSIMHVVQIDAEYFVWVPNAFTPDGDANNNSFGVMGEGIAAEEFTMQIFDRWGELIWESKDPTLWWDGAEAIQGVYAYRIEATNRYSRIKKEYLGHVTLLR